jgi:hypothetical protein
MSPSPSQNLPFYTRKQAVCPNGWNWNWPPPWSAAAAPLWQKKLGEYLAVAPQSSRDQKLLFFSMVEYHRSKRSEVQKPVAAHG